MKVAFIPSKGYLKMYGGLTDYHMALTHLVLKNANYAEHYRRLSEKGHYVILDNSVIELGNAVTMEQLLAAAELVGASEIVLPDVLDDSTATLASVYRCLEQLESEHFIKYRFMAVPQGATLDEFVESYEELVTMRKLGVHSIGIPKRAGRFYEDPEAGICGRYAVLSEMLTNDIIETTMSHHLLGVWSNPIEIKHLNQYAWIRGVDTQLPFWAASEGIVFNPVTGMTIDRQNKSLNLEKNHLLDDATLNHNIISMLGWANESL